MSSMGIHEMYGRLMEERQQEHEAHLRTIALLAEIKAGRVAPQRIEITGGGTGWALLPSDPVPAGNLGD